MPKITEVHLIDITPEHFLENCSPEELRKIDHLIRTPRFRDRIPEPEEDTCSNKHYPDVNDCIDPIFLNCH